MKLPGVAVLYRSWGGAEAVIAGTGDSGGVGGLSNREEKFLYCSGTAIKVTSNCAMFSFPFLRISK